VNKITELGKAIKKACIDANISMKELANSIGVSSTFISGIIRGQKNPPINLVEKIDDYFNKIGIHDLKLRKHVTCYTCGQLLP
jgi:transcriptional regulator with XRE-family HTH domain